jgi:hypothetical protein
VLLFRRGIVGTAASLLTRRRGSRGQDPRDHDKVPGKSVAS